METGANILGVLKTTQQKKLWGVQGSLTAVVKKIKNLCFIYSINKHFPFIYIIPLSYYFFKLFPSGIFSLKILFSVCLLTSYGSCLNPGKHFATSPHFDKEICMSITYLVITHFFFFFLFLCIIILALSSCECLLCSLSLCEGPVL